MSDSDANADTDVGGVDPDSTAASEHHAFWADDVADEIEARDPTDPIVIKGGVSPSGIPHLGHFNEIMRGYYVAEVLRERGHEVRQVFTSDDRDALRKVPRTLADADWNLVGLGDVDAGALGRNLGVPYTDIPDPFDDCDHDSYGEHFTALLAESAERIGVPVEMLSNTAMYEAGEFDDVVHHVLSRADRAREVLSAYQDGVDDAYVPFMAQCSECKRLTTDVRAIDLDARTVDYVCSGLEAGGQQIEGCGHEGTATFREGKLPWRFEWPAQWQVLGVDFEPFGKDHAEGSWPSGEDIAENVLEIQPPVPMTYEWFTLNGEPLSSSSGNVVTVDEVLELLEPEVLRYFFARNPKKAKDFDLSRMDQLVDEFDRFEQTYFGEVEDSTLQEFAERAYPFVVDEVRGERVRIPYTFAAVLGMTDDRELREQMARNEGHLADDTPEWAVEAALARVERARAWAERMDNEYNYRLQADLPETEFDPSVEAALDDLADFVAAGHSGEEIQGQMYELPDNYGVETGDFFNAGYRLFFDADSGPRLGEFLGELDRTFVVRRLRREE
ncbi:lysine--tRNA ligase [Salinigranum rubrum]|uniref:Lysine--tRNA ligase n=1 Tax=Salinigranum rubrum TaxID=755307 RepID=A0A2I8VMV7_9EURY|nr:lysine--tRNA ligase [Salinigranum rubrum]AUV83277.1 lysine--tRNA ligase [Salinigranum rubrum]